MFPFDYVMMLMHEHVNYGDAKTFTCDVTNITNISALKIVSKLFVNIDPRNLILSNHYTFDLEEQLQFESRDCFELSYVFKRLMFTLSNSASSFEVLPLCFRKFHNSKNDYIFPHICIIANCHYKDFTGCVRP